MADRSAYRRESTRRQMARRLRPEIRCNCRCRPHAASKRAEVSASASCVRKCSVPPRGDSCGSDSRNATRKPCKWHRASIGEHRPLRYNRRPGTVPRTFQPPFVKDGAQPREGGVSPRPCPVPKVSFRIGTGQAPKIPTISWGVWGGSFRTGSCRRSSGGSSARSRSPGCSCPRLSSPGSV